MRSTRTALRTALAATATLAVTVATGAVASAGVSGPAFYVDGTVYRTVATPSELFDTGAPAHSFDTIYDFGGAQRNVATAAPGDRDYNGGRWRVHTLTFPGGYAAALAAGDLDADGVLDSDAELAVATAAGAAVDAGVVASFVCPVIPLQHGRG